MRLAPQFSAAAEAFAAFEAIGRRQGEKLDLARIRHWGAQFAELKEDPDLLLPFEEAVKTARLR